ncbi:MAG: hypothetical protein L0I62_09980 [Gammaproteobacteria bacterium]|nr:hypothetical protein [Gammaproteobacteria bacterium]
MAEETVDRAIETAGLDPRNGCRTHELPLVGAEGYRAELADELAEAHDLDRDIAGHLARAYGGLAARLLAEAHAHGKRRLAQGYPYIEAEVLWARRHEMALTAEDVLARRLRLAFLDETAAAAARPCVEALLHAAR